MREGGGGGGGGLFVLPMIERTGGQKFGNSCNSTLLLCSGRFWKGTVTLVSTQNRRLNRKMDSSRTMILVVE